MGEESQHMLELALHTISETLLRTEQQTLMEL
jgi:hypothetical protein